MKKRIGLLTLFFIVLGCATFHQNVNATSPIVWGCSETYSLAPESGQYQLGAFFFSHTADSIRTQGFKRSIALSIVPYIRNTATRQTYIIVPSTNDAKNTVYYACPEKQWQEFNPSPQQYPSILLTPRSPMYRNESSQSLQQQLRSFLEKGSKNEFISQSEQMPQLAISAMANNIAAISLEEGDIIDDWDSLLQLLFLGKHVSFLAGWEHGEIHIRIDSFDKRGFVSFSYAPIVAVTETVADMTPNIVEPHVPQTRDDRPTAQSTDISITASTSTPQVMPPKPPILTSTPTPKRVEKRLALVIGNSHYKDFPLPNPVNDARAMETSLHNLGFDVMRYENLTQRDMKKAIDIFGQNLKRYDTGLFFYSGHGTQVNGGNYLIPIDANPTTQNDVEYDCINAGRILAKMEDAENKTNIIILDACRNNPFEKSWTKSANGHGLAFMNAPSGSLIAYATSPGNVAFDDPSQQHSPYTAALLANIETSDITILEMFQQVRVTVEHTTENLQTPWESTSLRGNFYFKLK